MANSATIDLKVNKSELSSGLADSKSIMGGWATAAKGVFLGAAAAVATFTIAVVGVGLALRSTIEDFNVQAAAETKLESVLRATGEAAGFTSAQLQAIAADLQSVTRFGDETIINAQALLATFKEVKGDQFRDATMAALDMSTVLGGDLNGTILQLGKALNDPIRGISALSRSGVSFTEEQKGLIRVLQESGDVMGAQQIILDELASEFGGAAVDATAGFAGQQEQLKNTMGDLREEIGEATVNLLTKFLPAAQTGIDILTVLKDVVVGTLDSFGDMAEGSTIVEDAMQGVLDFTIAFAAGWETLWLEWENVTATIVASLASATDVIDHVRTQLPYALVAGGVALVGFAVVGAFLG